MSLELSGNYGVTPGRPETTASRVVSDRNFTVAELQEIATAHGSNGRLTADSLVAAGFSRADATAILDELQRHFASQQGAVDLATPHSDAYTGIQLALPQESSFAPGEVTMPEPAARRGRTTAAAAPAPAESAGETAPVPARWGPVTREMRQERIQAVHARALELYDQGVTGPELWSQLTEFASQQYAGLGLSAAQQSDFVMQDLGVAILGPSAYSHLHDYCRLHPANDPVADQFLEDFAALGLDTDEPQPWVDAGWAGMGLDEANGTGFRPEINDGSDNQIFHTFAYQFLAYATNDPGMVHAGSLLHETEPGLRTMIDTSPLWRQVFGASAGHTPQDHNAGMLGAAVGTFMRSQRDSTQAAAALDQWGEMTSAAYGRDGGSAMQANPPSPLAQAMSDTAHAFLTDTSPSFLNGVWALENMAIRLRHTLDVDHPDMRPFGRPQGPQASPAAAPSEPVPAVPHGQVPTP